MGGTLPWLAPLLLLWSCTTGPRDRDLYLESIRAGAGAREICARIGDVGLRDDCTLHAAARAAEEGDLVSADSICEGMASSRWHEECWFLVNDQASATGVEAVSRCRRTGSYAPQCTQHAAQRELQDLTRQRGHGVGDEAEIRALAHEVFSRYDEHHASRTLEERIDEAMASLITARHQRGTAFDAALCGAVDPWICGMAYLQIEIDTYGHDVRARLCDGPLTEEALATRAGTRWTEGSGEVVLSVLAMECERPIDP